MKYLLVLALVLTAALASSVPAAASGLAGARFGGASHFGGVSHFNGTHFGRVSQFRGASHFGGVSVFPQPVDPWAHWGHQKVFVVQPFAPVVVVPRAFVVPRVVVVPKGPGVLVSPHFDRFFGTGVVVAPGFVWVPDHWAWNGVTWTWVRGQWVPR